MSQRGCGFLWGSGRLMSLGRSHPCKKREDGAASVMVAPETEKKREGSARLRASGWWFIPPSLATAPADILAALGPIVPSREGALHRDLVPYPRAFAPRDSMSALTGTDEQPMHTDAAYAPCPPRYIAFQCLDPGEAPCPTLVWTLDVGRLKQDRPAGLTSIKWVTKGGGRPPFYCSVVDVQREEIRIRFDPLCMRPICGCIEAADEAEQLLCAYSRRLSFEWERGAMLLVDNWRCLHARGRGADSAPSRRLRRWSIGVDHGLVV